MRIEYTIIIFFYLKFVKLVVIQSIYQYQDTINMKLFSIFALAFIMLTPIQDTQESKKIFIQSVDNKIELGPLTKNRNLSFGVKNILLENLQELNYEVTDSVQNSDYSVKVELLYFDILQTNSGFSVFHKNDSETILRIKGYLYNKQGKKIKEYVATGKSSEVSVSTLIIAEDGKFNQTSVSNVIKKSSETLIQNLFK
jgi:thioredoxin-related protein